MQIIPTANPDQLALFKQGRIDAVWTVEPWVSRLEQEADGKVYIDQKDALTTILVSSVKLLRERPELATKFVAAHVELTKWLGEHPEDAREQVRAGLSAEVRREISATLVASAWSRLHFTDTVQQAQVEALVGDAQSVGFLRDAISLDRLFSRAP
ncbi:MAG: hypothetical protein BWX86_01510 [Verrucomicrobia bacterium ADurb.Bin122]|nr:MAG: hypothetical protein BWX86_01510 [Verrucomicrobia bacterium ADurb.Bin122]